MEKNPVSGLRTRPSSCTAVLVAYPVHRGRQDKSVHEDSQDLKVRGGDIIVRKNLIAGWRKKNPRSVSGL
jgi:hypothetical protein